MVHILVTLKFGSSMITLGYNLVKKLRDCFSGNAISLSDDGKVIAIGANQLATKMELGVKQPVKDGCLSSDELWVLLIIRSAVHGHVVFFNMKTLTIHGSLD